MPCLLALVVQGGVLGVRYLISAYTHAAMALGYLQRSRAFDAIVGWLRGSHSQEDIGSQWVRLPAEDSRMLGPLLRSRRSAPGEPLVDVLLVEPI